MTEQRYDLVPASPGLTEPTRSAPLDPAVQAEVRRTNKDRDQLAWDACADPALMMRALVHDRHADLAVLIPPMKFIEYASARFASAGRNVDKLIWMRTMESAFRHLSRGRVDTAVLWLRHAYSGAGLATPEDALREMADIFRGIYPAAPYCFNLASLNARARARDAERLTNDGPKALPYEE